jgi:hypothetical protein
MSQQLIPVNGGVQTLQTTTQTGGINTLSVQYIKANGLENRPTEWVVAGRPIYRRLPAVSDTYQVNFFDIVPASNTAIQLHDTQDIGYVYVPWGEGIFGPISLEAVSSDSREDLIIKSGQVVWKYGTTAVPPAIVNLQELDFGSGRYLVTYQLVYDDSPIENYYAVEDYALTGTKLILTSSTDTVIGWRYPAVNSFLNSTTYWSNSDTYFPGYAQPSTAFLQWVSNEYFKSSNTSPETPLYSAYSKVTLRCPAGTTHTGTATFSYVSDTSITEIAEESILTDTDGQYFEFNITEPSFQKGWRVDFSDVNMKIEAVTVSGIVTKVTQQAEPSTRCALSIYPENAVPTTVTNSRGDEIPATYCNLAFIDVDAEYKLLDIKDIRSIVHTDYKPVADWLTVPFDDDLIDLYEQVKSYSVIWMSPEVCVKQEYATLEKYGVEVIK